MGKPAVNLHRGVIALAVAAIVSLWGNLGALQAHQHSDSLIPVMVSLYNWTPRYWDQNRYGMIIPALARPLADPFLNLLFQNAVSTFLGACSLLFLPMAVMGPRAGFVGGVLALAFFCIGQPVRQHAEYFGMAQPYGTALGLAALGLAVFRVSRDCTAFFRLAVAILLFNLAVRVNPGVLAVLLPLLVFRLGTDTVVREYAVRAARRWKYQSLGVLVVAAVIFLRWIYRLSHRYPLVSPAEVLGGMVSLGKKAATEFLPPGYLSVAGIGLAAGLAALLLRRRRRGERSALARDGATVLVMFAVSGLSLLAMGALDWVKVNGFAPRYGMQAFIMLDISLGSAAAALAGAFIAGQGWGRVRVFVCALLFIGLARPYGVPSPQRARAELDRTLGVDTPALISSGATHLIGSYTPIWPAVFHANMTLWKTDRGRRIWAITGRSGPTEKLWRARPYSEWKLAAYPRDGDVRKWADYFHLPPLRKTGSSGRLEILKLEP